jgi:hypothetical protein
MQSPSGPNTGIVVAFTVSHPMSGIATLVLETKDHVVRILCERSMTAEALFECWDGEPPFGKEIWYETDRTGILSMIGPAKPSPNRPYRFAGPQKRSLHLVVFAPTLLRARAYVRRMARRHRRFRPLKYLGEGNPDNRSDWAATALGSRRKDARD